MEISAIDTSAAIAANPSFTVSRAALLPVLDIMARKIIERRNTLPILSNVLIEASPSGELRLTGTNLDMELSATLSAEIEQPGAFTVSAATLRDIVKKADKDADIRFNADDGRVLIASGRIRQSLPTLPRDDFPIMAMADDFTLSGEFDAVQFAGDLSAVKPAICKEETRYYLRGIFFDIEGDALCMAATDGHRMAQIKRDADKVISDNFGGGIVPQGAIDAMLAILKGETGPVVLDMSPSKYRLQCGAVTLYGKLIDGTFPDYRRCIPNPHSLTAALSVESKELLQHCATAKGQDGKVKLLSVEIEAGSILAGVGGAKGFARPLSAEYDGRDCVFAMNAPYIESFAKLGDRLTLQCGNFDFADVDGAPIRITLADMPEFTGVLMPVRYGVALPKPKTIEYVETLPAPGQAADLFDIEAPRRIDAGNHYDTPQLIGIAERPRKATNTELEVYSRDYAARLGLSVGDWAMEKAKYTFDGPCYAVTFDQGNNDECNHAVTVLLPGYGQDRAPVTVQYQDDAGDYSAPMACTNAKGQIALPDAPKVRKAAKPRASTRRVFDGKGIDPAYIAAPVATPISEAETVAPVSAELDSDGLPDVETCKKMLNAELVKHFTDFVKEQSAPQTQEADVSATLAAPEPEIALCEPESQPETAIEPCAYPIADVLERLERLERALLKTASTNEAVEINTPPVVAMETDEPLSVQSKPKRSPAHIRAIMAYLAMRKERALLKSGLAAASEYTRKVEGERDLAIEQQANTRAAAKRYKDEMERAEISERLLVHKRRRAVLSARVRSQAAWQLGKALVTNMQEAERLKRVSYQQAGHIINLGERIDKAEQLLRSNGYWPDITVTAPDVIRMGAMQ